MEMLYCGKSGPKTPNSYQGRNLGAPEYKAVTIANVLCGEGPLMITGLVSLVLFNRVAYCVYAIVLLQ